MFGRNRDAAPASSTMTPARPVSLKKDDTGAPAVSLEKVEQLGGVSLAKKSAKAGISLSKRGLAGIRAQVCLYVDHSGSMEFPEARDYTNGNVQKMVELALGFGLQVDVDGVIPVKAFDSRLWPAVNVGLQAVYDNEPEKNIADYRGVVNRSIWRPRDMGGTSFVVVLRDILAEAKKTNSPILAVIITDGSPGDSREATKLVKELAAYPVFLKFLAIRPVDYLDELDNLEETQPGCRLVDNVDSKFFDGKGKNPPPVSTISDLEFADAMADEWNKWIDEATKAGVLV